MAWSDWLSRARDYGNNVLSAYGAGDAESQGLPAELAARQSMSQGALDDGQSPAPTQPAQPAQPVGLAPYEHTNPGYAPIGGANALRRLYRGNPPTLKQGSPDGF